MTCLLNNDLPAGLRPAWCQRRDPGSLWGSWQSGPQPWPRSPPPSNIQILIQYSTCSTKLSLIKKILLYFCLSRYQLWKCFYFMKKSLTTFLKMAKILAVFTYCLVVWRSSKCFASANSQLFFHMDPFGILFANFD